MKFIHLSDLHLVPAGQHLFGISPLERFRSCIADIARNHADAALCVITGDLTESGDIESYQLLRQALERLPLDVHLLVGNCDDRANFHAVFGEAGRGGFVQSAISRNGYRFIFLDTLGPQGAAEGHFDKDRREWLRRELGTLRDEKALIFMHHPPFKLHLKNDAIRLGDEHAFASALEGAEIHHIFFGHVHRPVSGTWRGIPFSCVPGMPFQIPLADGAVASRMSDEPPMYAVVLLEHDRTIVHSDAFLHRRPAQMPDDAERGTWY